MLAAVDCRVEGVADHVVPSVSDFSCTACGESFASGNDLRVHVKTERHLYNTKRRLAGLKPISQEAWERKLSESRKANAPVKGTSHLKAGKEKKGGGSSEGQTPSSKETQEPTEAVALTECDSLFDNKSFDTMEEALAYMQKTYSFAVPDKDYCKDMPGLMKFLAEMVSTPPYVCIGCGHAFPGLQSVRRHMVMKCHTNIATQVRTRTGNLDEETADELKCELDRFYDYHASTREITEKMKPPEQIAALHRYFDSDRDGYLGKAELATMWSTMKGGDELSDTQYKAACAAAGAKPRRGLGMDELKVLYESGLADLAAHWDVLQDLLSRKTPTTKRGKQGGARAEEGAEAEDTAQVDDTEQDEESGEDTFGGESEDGDSDGTDIIECEDEDEYEEVMRVLGLQPASVTDNYELRLASGAIISNRYLSYIYKRRGRRVLDEEELALAKAARSRISTPLALTGGAGGGGYNASMTPSQQKVQMKKVVAVLRRKNLETMRLGVKQNLLQTKKGLVNRTGRGDCSYGR